MKYFLALFFIALVFCLGACSYSKKLQASAPSPPLTLPLHLPDTLPTLPASEIDLPLKVYARPILVMADSMVPKEFTSDGWPNYLQSSCDFRYKYRFTRSAFILSCTNNKLNLQLSGNYQVAGGRCFCTLNKPVSPWISGTCGFG